jgi:hypothetical protein
MRTRKTEVEVPKPQLTTGEEVHQTTQTSKGKGTSRVGTEKRNKALDKGRESSEGLQKITGEEHTGKPKLGSGGRSMQSSPEMLRVTNQTSKPKSKLEGMRNRPLPQPKTHVEEQRTHELPPAPNTGGLQGLQVKETNFQHRQDVGRHFAEMLRQHHVENGGDPEVPEGLLRSVVDELVLSTGEHATKTSLDDPDYGAKLGNYCSKFEGLLKGNSQGGQKLWESLEGALTKGVSTRQEKSEQLGQWKKDHGVIWPIKMNQGDMLTHETDFRLENGICQAASYQWCRDLQHNPMLLTQATTAGKINDEVRDIQHQHIGDDGPQGYTQRMLHGLIPDTVCQHDGVKERLESCMHLGPPSTGVSTWLKDAIKRNKLDDSGGTFILNMVHDQHENHAIGFQVLPEPKGGYSVRMYDVNEGCFEINRGRFESDDPKKGKKSKGGEPKLSGPGIEGALNDYFKLNYGDYSGFNILSYPKQD